MLLSPASIEQTSRVQHRPKQLHLKVLQLGCRPQFYRLQPASALRITYNIPALFIIIKAHSDKAMSAFENIFPVIAEIKGKAVIRKKP